MNIPHKIDLKKVEFPTASELAKELGSAENLGPTKSDLNPEALAAEVQRLSKALVVITNQSCSIASAVLDNDSKEPKEKLSTKEIEAINRALAKLSGTLGELGINWKDRIGELFDAGLPEEVTFEESREGITKEQIIRTVRPTIMWNQTMVQRGQIEIAVPSAKK